jgi:zinc transport system substrate-binding protein
VTRFLFPILLALVCLTTVSTYSVSTDLPRDQLGTVLVSVAPYRYFVQRIAGSLVHVEVMVPPGASSHTYEPSPRQMVRASKANLWFTIGDSFEPRLKHALQAMNPKLVVSDLRKNVDLIQEPIASCAHCQVDGVDPHTWMSLIEAKKQAIAIEQALTSFYPNYAKQFQQNLQLFLNDLESMQKELYSLFKGTQGKTILVSHPAYGYLVRDYGLNQISIEFEGKDPSPKQLTKVMEDAKKQNIYVVFTQPQHSTKGAKLIADHLGAEVVDLDPYAENYLENIRHIALAFRKSFETKLRTQ